MRVAIFGTAAVAFGGLLSLGPAARAADTVMLGGVGSMSRAFDRTPTLTLEGAPADTVEVFRGPIARGVVGIGRGAVYTAGRVAYGAGRVAYGAGRFALGYRPFYGYYRPWGWYRPYYGFYRPWGYYRPWYGVGFGFGTYLAGYPYYYPGYYAAYPSAYYSSVTYASPSVVVAYAGAPNPCTCGPAVVTTPPVAAETAPMPVPQGGYRYDGGPTAPVPMPMPKATTPPPPAAAPPPAPMVGAVASRAAKKLEYPAYGEGPTKPKAPAAGQKNLLLVKGERPE